MIYMGKFHSYRFYKHSGAFSCEETEHCKPY